MTPSSVWRGTCTAWRHFYTFCRVAGLLSLAAMLVAFLFFWDVYISSLLVISTIVLSLTTIWILGSSSPWIPPRHKPRDSIQMHSGVNSSGNAGKKSRPITTSAGATDTDGRVNADLSERELPYVDVDVEEGVRRRRGRKGTGWLPVPNPLGLAIIEGLAVTAMTFGTGETFSWSDEFNPRVVRPWGMTVWWWVQSFYQMGLGGVVWVEMIVWVVRRCMGRT